MLQQTDFLIEILANINSHENELDIITLIICNIIYIDSHKISLALSLLELKDSIRYEAFNALNDKIDALTVEDLSNILKCFDKDEYKYEIITKTIKKCLPFSDHTEIIFSFGNETLQIDVSQMIEKSIKELHVNELISSLKVFPEDERLNLLEKSIAGTGIRLDDSENHCEELRDVFGNEYSQSCDILGINPDIYKNWL